MVEKNTMSNCCSLVLTCSVVCVYRTSVITQHWKYKYRLYDEKEGNTGFISPRKPMYRCPERVARGRLFQFLR